MRDVTRVFCLPAAAALALAGCTTMEKQIQSSGAMGQVDDAYVTVAYDLVQLDDAAAKLAATKASDPRVKDLATQIAAQAATLSPGLQAAVRAEGKRVPAQPSPEVAAEIAQLQGLAGAAFDARFVADELALHQRAVAVFSREASQTKDGAMRMQVETEQPAVQDNLDKLRALSGSFTQKMG